MRRVFSFCVLVVLAALAGCDNERPRADDARPTPSGTPREIEKIDDPHLENAHRVTSKVWGGAEPHDEAAFIALKKIGVRTIISVDGAKPDVKLAHKHGLRYVHLPIGYDRVPQERAVEIAKAFNTLPGPIYIHCHHGKHRSAAAAAVGCVINGTLNNAEALQAMKTFGTGENYAGLWDSARTARLQSQKQINALDVKFVESAPIPPLAEAMVAMDVWFEHLADCKKAKWRQPADHPDLDPPHEALKLRESFTEIMRTDSYKNGQQDFKDWMMASEAGAQELEKRLRAWKQSTDSAYPPEIDVCFKSIEKSCKDCHAKYRNVPKR